MLEFLEASGRMQELHAQDFVFVALADPLIHAPSGKSSDWKSSRPITQALVRFVLKQYARAAGLDPRRVTCPNLNHTAAVLKLQMGDDVEDIQEFLGRKSRQKTAEYLDKLASTGAPALQGQAQAVKAFRRGPHRAEPGNLQSLIHGYYSSHMTLEEREDLNDIVDTGLENEITVLRMAIKRTFGLSASAESFNQAKLYLDLLGQAAVRVGNLLKTQHGLKKGQAQEDLDRSLYQALMQLAEEVPLTLPDLSTLPESESDDLQSPSQPNQSDGVV